MKLHSHMVQQTLVATGIFMSNIADGFIFGQMSGMLHALRNDNTAIPIDDGDVSWIASTINITCFCGFALLGVITKYCGRKKAVMIGITPGIISWILTYFAMNKTTLHISRLLAGTSYGCTLFISYVNIGEYMTANMRSFYFNLLVCVASSVGTMTGHVCSILMDWRHVALLGLIPSLVSIVLPCFWVESPMWLASNGKYQESVVAFRALRPSNPKNEEELKLLLALERNKRLTQKNSNSIMMSFKKILHAIQQRYFWHVVLLSLVVNIYKVAAGKILFNTLAITMLQDITGTSKILLFTLLTNSFSIIGSSVACIFLIKYKTRNILFPIGLIANILLIILGIVLYSLKDNNEFNNWLKISLLSLYLVTVGIGPYPVLEATLTEIYPLEIKEFIIFILGLIVGLIQFLAIKLAPTMFLEIGYHGVFILNASIVFVCFVYLWFYLPETKGRSLQEIELYFKTNSFNSDTLNKEQEKELLPPRNKLQPEV